jgi:hypothetical protein
MAGKSKIGAITLETVGNLGFLFNGEEEQAKKMRLKK